MRRITGVLWQPRATMADVVRNPAFLTAWIVVVLVVAACGSALLSTRVGRQALVDERVRVVEALGGRVDDAAYGALQADPPTLVYLTSGGRLLLTPPVTLVVALGLMALAAASGGRIRYVVALAIAVHASVVLALQQVVATPLQYVRESLTSPTNSRAFADARRGLVAGSVARLGRRVRAVVDVGAGNRPRCGDGNTVAAVSLEVAAGVRGDCGGGGNGVCGSRRVDVARNFSSAMDSRCRAEL